MIQKVTHSNLFQAARLAAQLWPHHTPEEMAEDLSPIPSNPDTALFLAYDGSEAIGFAQCQLRRDYVEGTDSSPVGYLEGIFVRKEYRRMGIAKQLLAACEAWAKDNGCTEFASDCELTNCDSFRFHLALGFLEANRIICFTKKIGD
jgi:aminoglycoside 6'-N-acetyltransferase I